MAVIPAFVGVGRDFLSTSVGSTVHAFMEFEDVRIFLCEAHHPSFHGLVGVVLFELENVIAWVRPRENHVDIILGPNVLGCVARGRLLGIGVFGHRCGKRKQQWEDDEKAQRGARCGGAKSNGRG